MISVYEGKRNRLLIAISPDEDITVSRGSETPVGSIGLIEASDGAMRDLYRVLADRYGECKLPLP
jgi:hypothetical protein